MSTILHQREKERYPDEHYHICEIYDRDAADPDWYWVKWLEYRVE